MAKIKIKKALNGPIEYPRTEYICDYCKAPLYHILWDVVKRMNGGLNEELIINKLDIAHFCSAVCEEESKELYG